MIGHGRNTVEVLRELIAVPPKIERVLLAFARAHAEDAHWIEAALRFREATLLEFECMVSPFPLRACNHFPRFEPFARCFEQA